MILVVIALLSTDNYNPQLLGATIGDPSMRVKVPIDVAQQIGALVLWAAIIALSLLPGALRTVPRSKGLFWPIALLGFVVVSPAWSNEPLNGYMKSAVLLFVTVGAWRLSLMLRTEEYFECLYQALTFLLLASLVLVFTMPSIGLQHDWEHNGQWAGILGQKQGLGISAACLLFMSLLKLMRRPKLLDAIICVAAVACLLGSASRGGGVIAGLAAVSVIVARRLPMLIPVLIAVVFIDMAIGNGLIAYLATTGEPSISLFGIEIDFTQRTLIWQWAIRFWLERPLLGFGLNGFWTDDRFYYGFMRLHSWALDNYHSGYVAIMVETGLLGAALFSAVVVRTCVRLLRLMQGDKLKGPGLELALGFLIILFTIDVTETPFLRSTNFMMVSLSFLIIKIMSGAGPVFYRAKLVPGRRRAIGMPQARRAT